MIDAASLSATYDGAPHAAIVTTTPAAITVVALTYTDVATSALSDRTERRELHGCRQAHEHELLGDRRDRHARDRPRDAAVQQRHRSDPITYQAATATISGSVKAGTLPATGSVGITVSGTGGSISGSATVDASGDFTTTVNTSALPANPTGYDIALLLPQSTNFEQASDNTHKLVVNKATQSITFGALAAKTFGDVPFAVSATSSSTLAVTFSASGDCTVSGSTVTITGAGNCTVHGGADRRRELRRRSLGAADVRDRTGDGERHCERLLRRLRRAAAWRDGIRHGSRRCGPERHR